MPFPLSVSVKIRPFFLFIKAMTAREASACRATFARAAWTILKIDTAAKRSNLACAALVLTVHRIPVCPSNSLQVSRLKLDTRVVILTMFGDEPYLLDALGSGASGYLVKESCADDLFQAIREVAAGRYYLSPGLSQDFSRRHLRKLHATLLKLFPALATRQRKELQRALVRAGRGGVGRDRSLGKKAGTRSL